MTSTLPARTSSKSRCRAGRSVLPPEKPPSSYLARSREGERLSDLARNPLRGRICRHPERYPQSAAVAENHQTIEQPERNCRQHEEIDCRDAFGMIGQKGPPALARRAAIHVPRDRRLSEREAELEQFTMNVWRTPEVICAAHLANELAQFG